MLERIQKENDIKNLNGEELEILAEEIRQFLVEKVSRTGGHLASNLGVVELTVALHRVFHAPQEGQRPSQRGLVSPHWVQT